MAPSQEKEIPEILDARISASRRARANLMIIGMLIGNYTIQHYAISSNKQFEATRTLSYS
jgi:hypothetical protein